MRVCRTAVASCLGLVVFMVSTQAKAQYVITNLISNQASEARQIDPLLGNPWGLARGATSPWWVSDNITGWSTLYDETGKQSSLKVLIPTVGNGPTNPAGLNGPGMPTGIVFNGSAKDFQLEGKSSPFIFATLDGTISAWSPGVNANQAMIVYPNPSTDLPANKASYTGLAITSNPSGNFLYAADANNNQIDMFDGTFSLVKSFGDPSIPSNLAVFGIQDINGLLYVTFADPTGGPGGAVDLFTESGDFVKTLIEGEKLNQPWGIAAAPKNFGPLSNTLLISNNVVNGTINGFDPITGKFVGTIKEKNGKPLIVPSVWGIAFGGGNTTNGATNELFVAVAPANEMAGTFAKIVYKPEPAKQ